LAGGKNPFVSGGARFRSICPAQCVFCEPASAACVAGLLKVVREGLSLAGQTVVCVITGSGLKDPETAMKAKADLIELPADLAAIEKALGFA